MPAPVVLITGALTGIGRATALAFAYEGARIIVSGRKDDTGAALAALLRDLGAEADYVRADVRHEEDVQSLMLGCQWRQDGPVNRQTTDGGRFV